MNQIALMKKQRSEEDTLVHSLIKPASQLRGLTFGNKLDELLRHGLFPKTLTFLYGDGANSMMNVLCSNALRIFGGKAMFIDAANSFDPYLIVRYCSPSKSEHGARHFIESIIVSRAFTCYQLRKLVTSKLVEEISKKDSQIRSVFVSGISSVFSKEDNSEGEIMRFEFLMAQALRNVASDKKNNVLFVVASSQDSSENFVSKSDTAIKLNGKYSMRKGEAVLMKYYERRYASISI